MRGITIRISEVTTSSSISLPNDGCNRNDFLYRTLSVFVSHYTTTNNNNNNSRQTHTFLHSCPSYIYNHINLGLFTNMSSIVTLEHNYKYVQPNTFRIHLVGFLPSPCPLRLVRFLSKGTCFPTNSPFTLAWDVLSIRSVSGTCSASRLTTSWSTCLTRSLP